MRYMKRSPSTALNNRSRQYARATGNGPAMVSHPFKAPAKRSTVAIVSGSGDG